MIFVDTWAWVALADRSDAYHKVATFQHKKFQRARRRYVTTNFVLNEAITYLFDTLPFAEAQSFIPAVLAAVADGLYDLIHVSRAQFLRAWQMRQKYDDKPDISFVDFTSMVVMQELEISGVFTGDAHFRRVNLGFQLYP
jgi:predicted nucleic acid-binding protein